ncbi:MULTISPECIES: hypothetical protein [unclassified Bradyrhizobium]
MGIGSIAGGNAVSWPSSVLQTNSVSAAGSKSEGSKLALGMSADAPYDAIKVNLPNGMSVGVYSFGGTGLDSETLKTIEDFVQGLASQDIPGHQASAADKPSASSGGDEASDVAGLDKIHVDLPNGISFEVRHFSTGQTTDSVAVMKELTDAAEELAELFGRYSPASTAASAYATNQAASLSRANQVDTRT